MKKSRQKNLPTLILRIRLNPRFLPQIYFCEFYDAKVVFYRKKSKTWEEFIKAHFEQIWSCDFLLVPVLTMMGIKHFHVFVFIQYCTRQIKIVGIRERPDGEWMEQIAKNIACSFEPELPNCKYLIHDRDTLYTMKFEQTLKDFGITPIKTPPRSPNLNPFAERVIRSIKEEALGNMIILGERNLRKILKEYTEHYHQERNHQGIDNQIIDSENETLIHSQKGQGEIIKKERIGGLLNYYYRKSA